MFLNEALAKLKSSEVYIPSYLTDFCPAKFYK